MNIHGSIIHNSKKRMYTISLSTDEWTNKMWRYPYNIILFDNKKK